MFSWNKNSGPIQDLRSISDLLWISTIVLYVYHCIYSQFFLINTKWSLDQVWLPVITNHLSMLEKDHNFIIEPTVKSAEIYIWWQRKAKTLHFLSDFIARWVVHWLAKLQFRVLIIVWINKKKLSRISYVVLRSCIENCKTTLVYALFCFLQTAHLCIVIQLRSLFTTECYCLLFDGCSSVGRKPSSFNFFLYSS